jgi:predicted dehydrogenase
LGNTPQTKESLLKAAKVEDYATIVLMYPQAQVILQPSWDWPSNRKDMEIYGEIGSILVPGPKLVRLNESKDQVEKEIIPPPVTVPNTDPVSYFGAVVRHEIKPAGLSSLEVNLLVVEILDAAHHWANGGRLVKF